VTFQCEEGGEREKNTGGRKKKREGGREKESNVDDAPQILDILHHQISWLVVSRRKRKKNPQKKKKKKKEGKRCSIHCVRRSRRTAVVGLYLKPAHPQRGRRGKESSQGGEGGKEKGDGGKPVVSLDNCYDVFWPLSPHRRALRRGRKGEEKEGERREKRREREGIDRMCAS